MGYQEHVLLPTQWDAVYLVIEEAGFDPSEFNRTTIYSDVYGGSVPYLEHTPSGGWFMFDFSNGRNHPQWSPGEETPLERATDIEWQSVLGFLKIWLRNVERELASPNLWALLDQQRELLAATEPTGDTANTPFSSEEQAQLSAQLNEIKLYLVQTHEVDERELSTRIDYLIEASGRMGRKDWLNIFFGTIFGWALNGLVPPDGVREVLTFAAQGIGHLFGGLPQLPMP